MVGILAGQNSSLSALHKHLVDGWLQLHQKTCFLIPANPMLVFTRLSTLISGLTIFSTPPGSMSRLFYFFFPCFSQPKYQQRHWDWGDSFLKRWTLANETIGKINKTLACPAQEMIFFFFCKVNITSMTTSSLTSSQCKQHHRKRETKSSSAQINKNVNFNILKMFCHYSSSLKAQYYHVRRSVDNNKRRHKENLQREGLRRKGAQNCRVKVSDPVMC